MKSAAIILLSLLAAWWCILTIWVISCHRERVRAAAKPMTPEELEECRQLEASFPRHQMRSKDWLLSSPFWIPLMLTMLPIYLYFWFIRDPHNQHDRAV